MSEQEKDKPTAPVSVPEPVPAPAKPVPMEAEYSQSFFGESLVGLDPSELNGTLVVIEGMDGSGRSTQIALLQEWLESEGFAVQTMGLRRSGLVAKDIDALLAENTITRMTLTPVSY